MEQQAKSAEAIAAFLVEHPKVLKVHYLGLIKESSPSYAVYKKQYSSPGAMIAFDIDGDEAAAFRFLNKLTLVKLAVSLGSTESLVQHPASMTHIGIDPNLKIKMGISERLIRFSVGVEHPEDLIADLSHALEAL